MLFVNNAGSR